MDAKRDHMQGNDIAEVPKGDRRYPPLLREIADPPPVLYVRGDAGILRHPLPLAVVGTRKMTAYGATAIRRIVRPAAAAGAAIVSGLALGVDAAAHAAALDAGGPTVAVLAGGVDAPSVGPRTNAALAERIVASGGALVSEMPPGTSPAAYGFPRRNRIIAGMSRGTLVIEAAAKSGSNITAYMALEAYRDVFAVPGPITSALSAGTNALIRRGAACIACADDLLSFYGLSAAAEHAKKTRSDAENAVLGALEKGAADADAIVAATGLDVREVHAALTSLAIAGDVAEEHGAYVKN